LKVVQSLVFLRTEKETLLPFEVLREKIFVAKANDCPTNHLFEAALVSVIRDCKRLPLDAFKFVLSGPKGVLGSINDLLLTMIAHERFEDICALIEEFPWFYSEFRKGTLSETKFAKLKALELETRPSARLSGLVAISHFFTESGDLGLAILAAGQAMQLAQKLDAQSASLGIDFLEHSTCTYGDACFKYAKTLQDLGCNVSFKYAMADYNKQLLRLALTGYEKCKQFEHIEAERISSAKVLCYALLEQNFRAYFEQVRNGFRGLKLRGTRKALATLRAATATNDDYSERIGSELTNVDELLLLDLLINRRFKDIFDLLKKEQVVLDYFQCYRQSYWTTEHLDVHVDEHCALLESIFSNENPILTSEDFDSFLETWAVLFSQGSFGLALLVAGEAVRRTELLLRQNENFEFERRMRIAKLHVRSRFLFASALRDFGSISPLKMKIRTFQRHVLKLAIDEYSKALRFDSRIQHDSALFQLAELADCYSYLGSYLRAGLLRFKLDYYVELTLLICVSKKVCVMTVLGTMLGTILNFPGTFLSCADPVLPYYFPAQNVLLLVSLFPLLYFPELPRLRDISLALFKIGTVLLSVLVFYVAATLVMTANVFEAFFGFLLPFAAASFLIIMSVKAEQRIDRELGLEPKTAS
jgi:hypothetical protein